MDGNDNEREICSQLLKYCKDNLNFAACAYSYAFDELLYVFLQSFIKK